MTKLTTDTGWHGCHCDAKWQLRATSAPAFEWPLGVRATRGSKVGRSAEAPLLDQKWQPAVPAATICSQVAAAVAAIRHFGPKWPQALSAATFTAHLPLCRACWTEGCLADGAHDGERGDAHMVRGEVARRLNVSRRHMRDAPYAVRLREQSYDLLELRGCHNPSTVAECGHLFAS